MPYDSLKYTRCAVIVHGKSEFQLVRFIYTNLHLPVKIFPINTEPVSNDTLKQIRIFASKIKGVKQTNMLEFVEYCFEQIPDEKLWE